PQTRGNRPNTPPAGEDSQLTEERLLAGFKPCVARVDSCEKARMAWAHGALMGHEQLEAAAKPVKQLCRRERRDPTSGDLNGKRQALETTPDLRYIASIRRVHGEIWIATLRAVEEKADCTDLYQFF